MPEQTGPTNETTGFARCLLEAYRRIFAPNANDLAAALTDLFIHMVHLARETGQDPSDVFVGALLAAGQGDNRPWNAPEQRTYYSILVTPADGVTDRDRRDEITDMEVIVMRHDELMTRTDHRRVVTGRRGHADLYHDHDQVPEGPLSDAALDLWEEAD